MPLQHSGLTALYGARWKLEPELFDPDIAAQIECGFTLTGVDVARALAASDAVRTAVAAQFDTVDLVIGPTTPCVAWPLHQLGPQTIGGLEASPRGHAVFTPLFNHALTPALSIPCGVGRDNLPVGLQIVGPRGSDRTVLAIGRAMSDVLDVQDHVTG